MSRKIQLDEDCTLSFSGRSAEFADGVEVGILASLMDSGRSRLSRWIANGNIEQARALADRFGYRLTLGSSDDACTEVTLWRGKDRPRLSIVRNG